MRKRITLGSSIIAIGSLTWRSSWERQNSFAQSQRNYRIQRVVTNGFSAFSTLSKDETGRVGLYQFDLFIECSLNLLLPSILYSPFENNLAWRVQNKNRASRSIYTKIFIIFNIKFINHKVIIIYIKILFAFTRYHKLCYHYKLNLITIATCE